MNTTAGDTTAGDTLDKIARKANELAFDPLGTVNLFTAWRRGYIQAVEIALKQWLESYVPGRDLDIHKGVTYQQIKDIWDHAEAELSRRNEENQS
jgi:hypothetical protein